MAAVRGRACDEPGEVFDHAHLRPPTDVMVITSLPQDKEAAPKGRPESGYHSQVSGLSYQVSGTGYQVREPDPGPAPEPEHLNQMPDG